MRALITAAWAVLRGAVYSPVVAWRAERQIRAVRAMIDPDRVRTNEDLKALLEVQSKHLSEIGEPCDRCDQFGKRPGGEWCACYRAFSAWYAQGGIYLPGKAMLEQAREMGFMR